MNNTNDARILRELGREKFDIGNLPVQKRKSELWRKLNRLEKTRPLVWINEIPWHEMESSPELQLKCQDKFMCGVECGLRRELYQWRHFPCDMVVEPVIYSEIVGGPVGSYADYGIKEEHREAPGGCDVGYIPVIHGLADADKIRMPEVFFDKVATEKKFHRLSEIFNGMIPVKKRGIVHQWHSPWDQIIHWYGIEQLYMDMYDRPELVHRILKNFMRALNEVVDKQTELGMLDVGNGNWRVGSGGMGITDELPSENKDGHTVTPREQWGCSTSQIFSEVSPDMHEEFALQYERPMMERYGLTYYGCCEPLHRKMDILKTVRNLRKISMSPWINIEEASEVLDKNYVFSFKPNPAHLATDDFNEELVKNYLRDFLAKTKKNRREIILKDVTTIRNDPSRLDRWAKMTMALAEDESICGNL
ncbi:MAG: hypothetical protein NT118_15205 [Lentisphaerae bacterium]|nr:hypothetical protein [Lentisphaerota bacterium]